MWRDRVILYLRFVESWTLRELAVVLGITPERVRQMELRARKRLEQNRARGRA